MPRGLDVIVALVGEPGSGKSTLARALNKHGFSLVRVRGDAGSRSVAASGQLLDDDAAIDSVLNQLPGQWRTVIDGFPRTLPQAEALSRWAATAPAALRLVHVTAPSEAIEARLGLRARSDDAADTLATRRALFQSEAVPVLHTFAEDLLTVDATNPEACVRAILDDVDR